MKIVSYLGPDEGFIEQPSRWCSKTTDGWHAFDGFKDPDTCAACGMKREMDKQSTPKQDKE